MILSGREKIKLDRTKRQLLLSHRILTGVFELRCAQLTANVKTLLRQCESSFQGENK